MVQFRLCRFLFLCIHILSGFDAGHLARLHESQASVAQVTGFGGAGLLPRWRRSEKEGGTCANRKRRIQFCGAGPRRKNRPAPVDWLLVSLHEWESSFSAKESAPTRLVSTTGFDYLCRWYEKEEGEAIANYRAGFPLGEQEGRPGGGDSRAREADLVQKPFAQVEETIRPQAAEEGPQIHGRRLCKMKRALKSMDEGSEKGM